MSYFDRLQKEYGEMGQGKDITNDLQQAKSQAQAKLTSDEADSQGITGKVEGQIGKLVGYKVAGKYLQGKAVSGLKKYVAEPRRKLLDEKIKAKNTASDAKGAEAGEIQAKGMDRVAQGTNPDGSLKANPKSVREGLDDDIKFREGDVKPEDLQGDDINTLTQSNKTRYRALDDDGQSAVDTKLSNNPAYKNRASIESDVNNGNMTAEEGALAKKNSKFIEQDAIGDAEQGVTQGGSTALTGANPFTGGNVGGTAETGFNSNITGRMGDREGEMFDRETGMTAGETGKVAQSTAEMGELASGASEAAGATALETGLEAIPVIGEIAGVGLGLFEGVKDGIKSHIEQLKDQASMVADNANINTAMKYSGFSRPNFGSMALPSFDTSKSSALLNQ